MGQKTQTNLFCAARSAAAGTARPPRWLRAAAAGIGLGVMLGAITSCKVESMSSTPYLDKLAQGRLHVGSPKISPDRKFMLFQYFFTGAKGSGLAFTEVRLGVFELPSGSILPLQLPEGFSWAEAAISPDGRYIAVRRFCYKADKCPGGESGSWIVLGDFQQGSLILRKVDDEPAAYQAAPAFSPSGRWIAYVAAETYINKKGNAAPQQGTFSVRRRPVDGGPAETLLAPGDHPYTDLDISGLSYIDDDELLVSGHVPPQHRDEFPALYGPGKDTFYLHLTVGKGVVPISQSPRFAWVRDFPDLQQLTFNASGTGLFTAQVRDATGKVQRAKNDLYVVENGGVRALGLSELGFGLGDISKDGALVATSRGGDIVLVDTATGTMTRTGISARIQEQVRQESSGASSEQR